MTTTQAHFRSWPINHELKVVFSTNCTKFVEQDQWPPKMICSKCKEVVGSPAFKRALRIKLVPLERMKFIPSRYRGPLEDLGAKFAAIQGLSELLHDVSSTISCPTKTNAKVYDRICRPQCGCGLFVVLSKVNTMTNLSSWP